MSEPLFPREAIALRIQKLRKQLEHIESTTPQYIEMHMKAIWIDGQIFALEELLIEF